MIEIMAVMAAGIAAGRLLRGRRMPFLGRATNALIWLLLFLLGVEVGSDERIVNGIATLGAEACAVAVAAVAGCSLTAWLLWRVCAKGKTGKTDPTDNTAQEE